MTYNYSWGGDPNFTSAFNGFPNSTVYTPNIAMPGGINTDTNGNRVIRIYQIGVDYVSGGTGVDPRLFLNGGTVNDFTTVFNPAPTFNFDLFHASGTMYFGRNTNAGGQVINTADGNVWAGTLCGSFNWATVSPAPATPSLTSQPGGKLLVSFANAANDGGATSLSFTLQWANNSSFTGASSAITTTSPYTITGLTPGTNYWVRLAQNNEVGSSAWSGARSALVRSGGKRWNGSTWVPQRVRRWNGSAWVDQRVRRWNGTTWKDIQ